MTMERQSFKPLSDSLRQAREDVRILREFLSPFLSWEQYVALMPDLAELRLRPVNTLSCLKGPSPDRRIAGLLLVTNYWDPKELFTRACLEMAFRDSDARVRGAALEALANLYSFLDDETGDLRLLLNAVFSLPFSQMKMQAKHRVVESSRLWTSLENVVRNLAGPHFEEMNQDMQAAMRYARQGCHDLRQAALITLLHHWNAPRAAVRECEAIAQEDPSTDVRCLAVTIVGTAYADSDDAHVGRFLRQHVVNEENDIKMRWAAYSQLFVVRGMPLHVHPGNVPATRDFHQQVDWSFVGSFADAEVC